MKHSLRTIIITYVASAGAIWGIVEAYTYFAGDQLKHVLGGHWPWLFLGLPALIAIVAGVRANRRAQPEPANPPPGPPQGTATVTGSITTEGNIIAAVNSPITITSYAHARPQETDPATLAQAEALLAALPLDTIPAPAALPPGSRMPFAPNPLFVGRARDLQHLARALKDGTGDAPTAAIGQIAAATGLGGIGKTQLASEFAHRYGPYFAGGVFWLSFADSQAIPAEIASCGGSGGLDLRPDFGALPLDDQVRLVLSAWQSQFPRLLVFDNCEDETLLAHWRPPTGGARILVTSRRAHWNPELGVCTLPLDILDRPASTALLRQHRPDLSEEQADAIAHELGYLPLALHLAGSFLGTYRHAPFGAPDAYLEALRATGLEHISLTEDGKTLTTGHACHVRRTFALSYERLDGDDPIDAVSLALLARAACFAPGETIPRELLLATLDLSDNVAAQRRAEDAVARLTALGLLDEEPAGALRLHRLLVAFVRQTVRDDAAQVAVEETVLTEARRLNKAGYPEPLLAWQPHLRHITDTSTARADERAAWLCNELGYHLQMIADYTGARLYYERALAINEQVLGAEHPHTATSLNNLGMLSLDQINLAGARQYLERALAIQEKVLGAGHPDTANSLNNLGMLLQAQGDLEGARPYLEQALAIREKVLGAEHPDTATSLQNLGMLLRDQGDLAGARQHLERALTIREQVLGTEHLDTAGNLNNLGLLLLDQGDLAKARPYYEQALAIIEHVLGPEHPHTATSLNNLGMLLQHLGDLAEAHLYLKRALVIRKQVLGAEHPDTAQSLNNFGMLLRGQGNLVEARSYLEQALAIYEHMLGTEHPYTITTLNNLGLLLQNQGDLAGARLYYERALAVNEKMLGAEHPDTARSLNNLGMLLRDQDDLAGARPCLKRALAIRETVLGLQHPDTAASLNNFGMLLRDQGDLVEARMYFERALVIREQVLGAEHHDTAQSLHNLAILCYDEDKMQESVTLLRRALAICEAKLGPHHPDTQNTRQILAIVEETLHQP